MDEVFKQIAGLIALGVEAERGPNRRLRSNTSACRGNSGNCEGRSRSGQRKEVWLSFGVWLLLGLEFELAADIVRTAISPTWTDIGQLAAIGVIRTFLNYFLEKDLEKYEGFHLVALGERNKPKAEFR